MLDSVTKHRIDACRDILVGKVPDPKSQVEQITLALIYKFMDDMDAVSEEMGGIRSFFAGDFAKYGWAKLLSPATGGFEMIGLYGEAIARMGENPGVPTLFRDIFKNAYLPYKDPETLRAFLKEINFFTYEHSEKLGDAFEYLLSVLGSQGDAGQFRTPRHIIDFIVQVVNPQKNETILDPACGTAGFLISAYKHILQANQQNQPGDLLTTDERTQLAQNLTGYDISPDMVRLSLANLYLHGFPDPQVEEYDTLTSEDKWNDFADVILANPPFMSPKGGIKPHKRFSVQSNRSEVLFLDYIADHLTPTGRAGVIVPEGIIFQGGKSYKTLREMLVKNYLVAVVSLPAGVFQPYSGVKTSVLILDKRLAKNSDSVLFVKIASDGFGLGAQRRAVTSDDLPEAARLLTAWTESLRDGTEFEAGGAVNLQVVAKSKIAATVDYNLSGDRYRVGNSNLSHHPIVLLGSICEVIAGQSPEGEFYNECAEGSPFYQGKTEFDDLYIGPPKKWTTHVTKMAIKNDVLMSVRAPVGPVNLCFEECCIGRGLAAIRPKDETTTSFMYVFRVLRAIESKIVGNSGAVFASINKKEIEELPIPLPPLAVQQEIVAEIEGYQKVIDGARQVVENYKPRIDVQPEWPLVQLEEIAKTASGGTPSKSETAYWEGNIPWVSPKDMKVDFISDTEDHISEAAVLDSATKAVEANTLLCVVRSGILQHTFPVAITMQKMCFNQDIVAISPTSECLDIRYLFYTFKAHSQDILAEGIKPGVTVQSFHNGFFKSYKLSLPNLETQQEIVAEIEEEQRLVEASRQLIRRFEAKIKSAIGRVWGEAKNLAELEVDEGTETLVSAPSSTNGVKSSSVS